MPQSLKLNFDFFFTWNIVLLTCIVRVTQEYRENLTKIAKAACEQSKQSIRKVRQKGMSDVRKNKKGRSDDDVKTVEKMVTYNIHCYGCKILTLPEEPSDITNVESGRSNGGAWRVLALAELLDQTEAHLQGQENTLHPPCPVYLRVWVEGPSTYLKIWISYWKRYYAVKGSMYIWTFFEWTSRKNAWSRSNFLFPLIDSTAHGPILWRYGGALRRKNKGTIAKITSFSMKRKIFNDILI